MFIKDIVRQKIAFSFQNGYQNVYQNGYPGKISEKHFEIQRKKKIIF